MLTRRAQRSSSGYRPARVVVAPGEAAYFCVVHNSSDCGLCIELTFDAGELPDLFEFSFDDFRTIYICKTVWREENVAGIAFKSPPPEGPASRRAKFRLVK